MAIIVETRYPENLVDQIKESIDNQEIDTWQYDNDGDFTHTASQWVNHAWFRPYIEGDRLTFGILGRKDSFLTINEYGIYHGRFAEMLMSHFSSDITEIIIQSPFVNSKDTHKIEQR